MSISARSPTSTGRSPSVCPARETGRGGWGLGKQGKKDANRTEREQPTQTVTQRHSDTATHTDTDTDTCTDTDTDTDTDTHIKRDRI
eukprot:2448328-Rhodomonas_salina.1